MGEGIDVAIEGFEAVGEVLAGIELVAPGGHLEEPHH